ASRARVLEGDEATLAVTAARKKDGTTAILEATGQPVFDPDNGELVEVQAICRDVTMRVAAERALHASEERTRKILETAGDAFLAIDEAGRITGWNQQAEISFGWAADEVIGRPIVEVLIPPEHRDEHRRGLARFLATGEGPILGQRLELVALHRGGDRVPVELVIWALPDGERWSFNAFARDITERRRLEEERRGLDEARTQFLA